MLLLGIAGIIQVIWLPGYILLKITRLKTNWLGNLVFGFGLSLTFNYLLVLILATLRIFVQWLVIVIFCLELALAIWLSRKILFEKMGVRIQGFWTQTIKVLQTYFSDLHDHLSKKELDPFYRKLLFGLLFLLALIPLWWVIRIFIDNLGSVFNSWDAIVSWNQWATQWAANTVPLQTWRYPQLIPTNWALIYVITGNAAVQFFVKAIMPLFLLAILLLAIALGFEKQNAGFFLGGVISYFVIKHFLQGYIPEGYVDIPVAFMSLASIATLFWAKAKNGKEALRILFLGAILAGGAAVTKHTGLYFLAAFPLLAYLIVIRKFLDIKIKKIIKFLFIIVLISLVIAAPWYIFKEITFLQGLDRSETDIITTALTASSNGSGILQSISLATSQIGKYLVLYAVLLVSLLFIDEDDKWIVLLVVFPYTILWSLFLGYDIRNLAIAMPFLAILSGISLTAMLDWVYRKILRPVARFLPLIVPIFLLMLIPLGASLFVKSASIIDRQIALQKQIFSKSLDASLFDKFKGQELSQIKILTNYPVRFLPGFEQSQLNFNFDSFIDFQSKIEDPTIGYLLVPSYAIGEIQDNIQDLINTGQVKFLWEDHSWISYSFYEIIR